MSKQAQDRRIIKTKKKLKDTLVKLIQEKTIDKITVKELVEQADLNRGTFYFHYKNIYDFLETIETEALNEITLILFQCDPKEFAKYDATNIPYPPLVKLFKWFKDNQDFCKALVGRNGDILFLDKLSNALKGKLYLSAKDMENKTLLNNYVVPYSVYGFLGVLKQWIDTDSSATPQDMAVMSLKIIVSQMTIFK